MINDLVITIARLTFCLPSMYEKFDVASVYKLPYLAIKNDEEENVFQPWPDQSDRQGGPCMLAVVVQRKGVLPSFNELSLRANCLLAFAAFYSWMI